MPDEIWKSWISAPKPDPRVEQLQRRIDDLETQLRARTSERDLARAESTTLTQANTRLTAEAKTARDSEAAQIRRAQALNVTVAQVERERNEARAALEQLKPVADRYAAEEAENERQRQLAATRGASRFVGIEVD